MDDAERDRAANNACESRIDLIISMGIKDTRAMLSAAFKFGRAYGLTEANTLLKESFPDGPPPSL